VTLFTSESGPNGGWGLQIVYKEGSTEEINKRPQDFIDNAERLVPICLAALDYLRKTQGLYQEKAEDVAGRVASAGTGKPTLCYAHTSSFSSLLSKQDPTMQAKEKEATRARDALAAERRRQPRLEFSTDYAFEGPDGVVSFLDLFEGRRQLIVYHFWFPPDGEPCGGCTMFADQVAPVAHLNARDTSFALVSRASQAQIEAYKRRLAWTMPWYTVIGEGFQEALGTTQWFALNVFLRDEDRSATRDGGRS
jgi:hypothetical protein